MNARKPEKRPKPTSMTRVSFEADNNIDYEAVIGLSFLLFYIIVCVAAMLGDKG